MFILAFFSKECAGLVHAWVIVLVFVLADKVCSDKFESFSALYDGLVIYGGRDHADVLDKRFKAERGHFLLVHLEDGHRNL